MSDVALVAVKIKRPAVQNASSFRAGVGNSQRPVAKSGFAPAAFGCERVIVVAALGIHNFSRLSQNGNRAVRRNEFNLQIAFCRVNDVYGNFNRFKTADALICNRNR